MERAQTLALLQKENSTLPALFEVPEKSTQVQAFSEQSHAYECGP